MAAGSETGSPTLAVRPIPWHMSIHDSDYLDRAWSLGVVIMAAVPLRPLREVRSVRMAAGSETKNGVEPR